MFNQFKIGSIKVSGEMVTRETRNTHVIAGIPVGQSVVRETTPFNIELGNIELTHEIEGSEVVEIMDGMTKNRASASEVAEYANAFLDIAKRVREEEREYRAVERAMEQQERQKAREEQRRQRQSRHDRKSKKRSANIKMNAGGKA